MTVDRRWLAAGLVAAAGLPVLVATVAAATLNWFPVSDWALLELRTADVGSSHTPLVGPFSRFGWNHPGPLLFWLLALPYRLGGSRSAGLLVGAGLVNLAAVVGIGWLGWRRGGLALVALSSLLVGAFLLGRGPYLLVDPWNPSVVVLPFLLFALVTWSLSLGDHRTAPLAVVAGSWIVQSHVGFTPLVATLGLWGVGWWLARHRSTDGWRWLGATGVVGVMLWLPPVIQQLTTSPGNLAQIVRHFTGTSGAPPDDPAWAQHVGLGTATEVFGRHLGVPGVWLGGAEPTDPFTGELLGRPAWGALAVVAVLVGAAGWAWRRRATDAVLLAVQTGLGLAVGLVATTRIDGYAFPYLFGWLEALAVLLWLSVGWCAYRALAGWSDPQRDRLVGVGRPLLVAGAAVVLVAATVRSVDVDPPLPNESAAVAELAAPAVAAVGNGEVLLSPRGTCLSEAAYGIGLQLERAGVAVVVRDPLVSRFGSHRRWDGGPVDAEVVVACREAVGEVQAEAAADGSVAVVGLWDPTPEALADREDELDAALVDAIEALGRPDLLDHIDNQLILFSGVEAGLDPALLADYGELTRARNHRVAVAVGPAPTG